MKRVLYFCVLLLGFGCGEKTPANQNDSVSKDTIVQKEVKVDSTRKGLKYPKSMSAQRKNAFVDLSARIGDSMYHCSYKGVFQSGDTLGNRVGLLFDLKAEYLVDLAYILPLEDNRFYVSWQETDHRGMYSYYAVYERGSSKPIWKHIEKANSPGQPVIDSGYVYISSLGMVGKLDLNDGAVVWKFDSLFDPLSLRYKQFDRPVLYNNTACFYDFEIKGKKGKRDTIWVNESSGKIVR
jgi:hypothetical protein